MTDSTVNPPAVLIDRCICRNRSFADLLPEARARSWSLADLIRETGCGGQCGLCRPYLRVMLANGRTAFTELLPMEPA
jgi:bacterioferritin-associated ferredoxin